MDQDAITFFLPTWNVSFPSLPEGLDFHEIMWVLEALDLNDICKGVLSSPETARRKFYKRPGMVFCILIAFIEIVRYFWYRICTIALNQRRHTPPSLAYTAKVSFDDHAAFVENIICDRPDIKSCIEGIFIDKPLEAITRDMLEECVLTHLAMEVRRWYPKKHHQTAERIVDRIEAKLSHRFQRSKDIRERLPGGASIAQPIPYDSHPDAFRKPYLYIGEQKLCAYFKPLHVQMSLWMLKTLNRFFLRRWGFKWYNLGPIKIWVRSPRGKHKDALNPPLIFCPGLFLGNSAYMYFIYKGLMPLAETRPLMLLELPHLSHGIDPRKIGYAFRYSWPSTDEISDAMASFLENWPSPVDIIGNSFGTLIMTVMRREHPHLFRRYVYVDPVCFNPCYPSCVLHCAAEDMMYWTSLVRSCVTDTSRRLASRLIKYLILRPTIFGDLQVQYVLKRGMYPHESVERGQLGKESLVIIGSQDDLISDPSALVTWLNKRWPATVTASVDFNHGAMMGHPAPYSKLIWQFLSEDS